MIARELGATGLRACPIGLGAGPIGLDELDERDVDRLIGTALELGIDLIDTARSYGSSEERLGRHLEGRRDHVVLSTKVGYGIPDVADWTGPCITAGVERALRVLRTDRIDIVHLHSCPRDVLERGEVIAALERARAAGKIRVAAYSGDNDALAFAVASRAFGSIQCSASVCDQAACERAIPAAREAGLGVIAKRPIANAPWHRADSPYGDRWATLVREVAGLGALAPLDVAARFALFSTGAHVVLIGTRSPEHLREIAAIAARGPLPDALVAELRAVWARHRWPGVI